MNQWITLLAWLVIGWIEIDWAGRTGACLPASLLMKPRSAYATHPTRVSHFQVTMATRAPPHLFLRLFLTRWKLFSLHLHQYNNIFYSCMYCKNLFNFIGITALHGSLGNKTRSCHLTHRDVWKMHGMFVNRLNPEHWKIALHISWDGYWSC